ncbi:hypothetical protein [Marvinbryantia formatexigens]|nr:hypothetical protein [Marvinbryantia formatexigens]SDF37492.1 hypothetical protein SAMN05660368_00599 [Marvinbryantia formatexigens]
MAEMIVYFSRKDENYVSGTIRKLDIGNTEIAAGLLQKLTGADWKRTCFERRERELRRTGNQRVSGRNKKIITGGCKK